MSNITPTAHSPTKESSNEADVISFEVSNLEAAKGRDTIAQEQGRLSARSDTHNW